MIHVCSAHMINIFIKDETISSIKNKQVKNCVLKALGRLIQCKTVSEAAELCEALSVVCVSDRKSWCWEMAISVYNF